MAYTESDVVAAIHGRRVLDTTRENIEIFVAMTTRPYGENYSVIDKFGKFKTLSSVRFISPDLADHRVVIGTHKRGLLLEVQSVDQNLTGGFRTVFDFTISTDGMPAYLVEPVWSIVPRLLDELVKLIPNIKNTFNFYHNIDERQREIHLALSDHARIPY